MKTLLRARLTLGLLALASGLFVPSANASYKALSPNPFLRATTPLHVLVVGSAAELGDGFYRAAVSRAYYLMAQNPTHGVLVVLPNEPITNLSRDAQAKLALKGVLTGDREREWVTDSGLKVLGDFPGTLTSDELLKLVLRFRLIQSLEFFTHASWTAGGALESAEFANRFPFTKPILQSYTGGDFDAGLITPSLLRVRERMAPDGYAVMWGCNTAYTMAPMISTILQVPVYGSLTFTDFEMLAKDGNYYKEDAKLPLSLSFGGPWASNDAIGYPAAPLSCEKGCRRMKPNNVPYEGIWGNYDSVPKENGRRAFKGGGLGFFKVFCNFPDPPTATTFPGAAETILTSRCQRGMGAFMMNSISAVPASDKSFVAYKTRLLDFLCPRDAGQDAFLACAKALEAAESTRKLEYSSFAGNPIECDLGACNAVFDWTPGVSYGINQRSVRLDAPANPAPRTQVNEYLAYIDAYKAFTGLAPEAVQLTAKLEATYKAQVAQHKPKASRKIASKSKRKRLYPGPVDDLPAIPKSPK